MKTGNGIQMSFFQRLILLWKESSGNRCISWFDWRLTSQQDCIVEQVIHTHYFWIMNSHFLWVQRGYCTQHILFESTAFKSFVLFKFGLLMTAALVVLSLLTQEQRKIVDVGVKHLKYVKPQPLKYLFFFTHESVQICVKFCPKWLSRKLTLSLWQHHTF